MSPPVSSVKHWVPILGGCGNVRRWGKTLRTCFRRWDVAPSPCLFPIHHEENPGSFVFTMKRTLQASCSQRRELWMHLPITVMLSFQVLWMNKTRNSEQKHPSSLMLSCWVLQIFPCTFSGLLLWEWWTFSTVLSKFYFLPFPFPLLTSPLCLSFILLPHHFSL